MDCGPLIYTLFPYTTLFRSRWKCTSTCWLRRGLGQHSASGNHSNPGCEHQRGVGYEEHFQLLQWHVLGLEHFRARKTYTTPYRSKQCRGQWGVFPIEEWLIANSHLG